MGSQRDGSGKNRIQNRGSLQILTLSMVIFGTIGICRRFIGLPSDVIAFGRGIMGGVFLLLVLRVRRERFAWDRIAKKDFLMLVISGIMIGFNWILLFEAYNYTTVAVATLCYYMQPVIVIALSPVILREKLPAKQVLCIVISVIGMVLVSGVTGGTAEEGSRGVILGLGAAVLYASVVLMNKYIHVDAAFEKTIIQLFSAAAVMVPYMALTGTLRSYDLSVPEMILFLVIGVVHTGIAYTMYFGSMEALPARTCALLSYVDPVTAVVLSALFLHEPMSVSGFVGAVLIIGSAAYSQI